MKCGHLKKNYVEFYVKEFKYSVIYYLKVAYPAIQGKRQSIKKQMATKIYQVEKIYKNYIC